MAQSPLDVLTEQMIKTAAESATRVGTEVANHTVNLVRNSVTETLDGMFGKRSNSPSPELVRNRSNIQDEDVIDVESRYDDSDDSEDLDTDESDRPDTEYDGYDDSNRELPLAFNAYGKEGNFEAAVAAWKLWGRKHITKYDDPDIIVKHDKTELVFVGSLDEFIEFTEQNNLDDEWEFWGCNPTKDDSFEFNPDELDALSASKDAIKMVTQQVCSVDTKKAEEVYKGFHWDNDASVTRVVQDIPYLNGVPLAMLGVAECIIYSAKKDGKVQPFIHELGEESGLKPILYALPPPEGEKYPRALLIAGGNMRVEDKGICD
jgi:hypothetical protein